MRVILSMLMVEGKVQNQIALLTENFFLRE